MPRDQRKSTVLSRPWPPGFLPALPSTVMKRIESEVLPLLRAKDEEATLRQARQVIARLVVETHSAPITLVDKLLFLLACGCSSMHLPAMRP